MRAVDRTRRVSKTNLSVALLNLLYGGVDYLEAALDTVAGEAQLSALARVQETVRRWDFSADAAAAEELAGQPIVGYSLGEELAAAAASLYDSSNNLNFAQHIWYMICINEVVIYFPNTIVPTCRMFQIDALFGLYC